MNYSAPLTNEDLAITDRVYSKLPFGPCFRLLHFIRQESMDMREEVKDYCNYRIVDQVKEDINRALIREGMGGHLVEDWEHGPEADVITPAGTWAEASEALKAAASNPVSADDMLRFNTLADQMIEEMLRENVIIEPDPQKWIDWATKSERNADRVARFAQLIDGDETGDYLPSQAAMGWVS